MGIKELFRKTPDEVYPYLSPAWKTYIQSIPGGGNRDFPAYGQSEIIFDYYGLNRKRNVEQARVRIPLKSHELEISYHVTRDSNGTFETVYEGVFPYAG